MDILIPEGEGSWCDRNCSKYLDVEAENRELLTALFEVAKTVGTLEDDQFSLFATVMAVKAMKCEDV